jgi:DNA-binding XRE family transcriptional regulator
MSDHIITGWQYVEHTDEEITGKKGWWCRWIGWKITVEPPQTVMDHYTRIKVREPRKQTLSPPPEASILRETRLARGLTQMQAAEEIGVSQSLLSQIERGGKPRLAPATTRKIKKWMAGPA